MKFQLYPWQEECLKIWSSERYHGIINVVTGGGKTILALAAAEFLEQHLQNRPLRPDGEDTSGNASVNNLENGSAENSTNGFEDAARTGFTGSDFSLCVKIVVPTISLLNQWSSAILDFFGPHISREDIGFCCSGHQNTSDRKFMLYVVNSARYSLARHIISDMEKGRPVLLIADECHHYTSPENRKIFDFLPFAAQHPECYASLGLSATPGSGGEGYESVLVPALGKEIYKYDFSDAGMAHTLCRCAIFHIALSFTPDESSEYMELTDKISTATGLLLKKRPSLAKMENSRFFSQLHKIAAENGKTAALARILLQLTYTRKELVCSADSRISCTMRLISLLDKKAKIIIFGERIAQADALYEQLTDFFPNQAARYHSEMDPQVRKLTLERFHHNEIRILVTCRALDEGFDIPSANVGIVLSSASIERQRIQRMGRILRRYEGKDIASLYYLYISDYSAEQPSFFPFIPIGAVTCNLSYYDDVFFHRKYEAAVRAAMNRFKQKMPDDALLAEAQNCFRKGVVRPDWLLGKAQCAAKIKEAQTRSERNYWICMEQLSSV